MAIEAPAEAEQRPSVARLAGVDLARGLAVFGMFAAHVGPDPSAGGIVGGLMQLSQGRASALFATLAGLSLAIMSGRQEPATGLRGRQARIRIAIRAVILFVFGTLLTMTGTSVVIILAYYGLFFLLALPFTRVRAVPLAIIAAVTAIAGPVLSFVVRDWLTTAGLARLIAIDPIRTIGGESMVQFLFTGGYPVLTWMPFVFAGMALGRLDLTTVTTRIRLAVIGPALAVIGYGGSWIALRLFGGTDLAPRFSGGTKEFGDMPEGSGMPGKSAVPDISALTENGEPMGAVPTDTPLRLLGSEAHSGTPFEIIGAVGVAVMFLVGSLVVAEKLPRLWRPVTAVGSMSLTAYVLHVIAIDATGATPGGNPLSVLLAFIAGAIVFALVWSRFFRRGPLEFLLHKATTRFTTPKN